ncbi:MAG: hypothetical protein ACJ8AH_04295 [Stellaceae bacterium]
MSIVQPRAVMAGLDPAIQVRPTGNGAAGNCVDARVKPAHDDLRVVAVKQNTLNPFPGQPCVVRERGSSPDIG